MASTQSQHSAGSAYQRQIISAGVSPKSSTRHASSAIPSNSNSKNNDSYCNRNGRDYISKFDEALNEARNASMMPKFNDTNGNKSTAESSQRESSDSLNKSNSQRSFSSLKMKSRPKKRSLSQSNGEPQDEGRDRESLSQGDVTRREDSQGHEEPKRESATDRILKVLEDSKMKLKSSYAPTTKPTTASTPKTTTKTNQLVKNKLPDDKQNFKISLQKPDHLIVIEPLPSKVADALTKSSNKQPKNSTETKDSFHYLHHPNASQSGNSSAMNQNNETHLSSNSHPGDPRVDLQSKCYSQGIQTNGSSEMQKESFVDGQRGSSHNSECLYNQRNSNSPHSSHKLGSLLSTLERKRMRPSSPTATEALGSLGLRSRSPVIEEARKVQSKEPKATQRLDESSEMSDSSKPKTSLKNTQQPFTWELYLELLEARVAPKEAFMQNEAPLKNKFDINMKLAARDPRISGRWCLANVIGLLGPRIYLRFEGSDSSNDFYELVDSTNIKCLSKDGKSAEDLLPPMTYRGNISNYPKFVERILTKEGVKMAPIECFIAPPKRPRHNLFEEGMKLEAVDRKNPGIICPATIGEVAGNEVTIIFDGWKRNFDYRCNYDSRDLFPVNWCRDSKYPLTTPNGWHELLQGNPKNPLKSPINPKSKSPAATSYSKSEFATHESKRPRTKKVSPKIKIPVPLPPRTATTTQIKGISSTPRRPGRPRKNQMIGKMEALETPVVDIESSPSISSEEEKNPDEENESSDGQELADDGPSQYQCQRTVPYDIWRMTKEGKASPADLSVSSNSTRTNGKDESIPKDHQDSNRRPETDVTQTLGDNISNHHVETNNGLAVAETSSTEVESSAEGSLTCSEPKRKMAKLDCQVNQTPLKELAAASSMSASVIFSPGIPKPYESWGVHEVVQLLKSTDESLAKYAPIFENHEIDGKALVLLKSDMMICHMGLKIGPVLKIVDLIERVKRMK